MPNDLCAIASSPPSKGFMSVTSDISTQSVKMTGEIFSAVRPNCSQREGVKAETRSFF